MLTKVGVMLLFFIFFIFLLPLSNKLSKSNNQRFRKTGVFLKNVWWFILITTICFSPTILFLLAKFVFNPEVLWQHIVLAKFFTTLIIMQIILFFVWIFAIYVTFSKHNGTITI